MLLSSGRIEDILQLSLSSGFLSLQVLLSEMMHKITELKYGTDLTTGLRSGCAAVIWKDRGHPTTVIDTGIFVSSSSPI